LKVEAFTECGKLRRGPDVEKALGAWFDETRFDSSRGDDHLRSWTSWTRRPGRRSSASQHNFEESHARMLRAADALHGRSQSPGVDAISRSGTITIAVPEPDH